MDHELENRLPMRPRLGKWIAFAKAKRSPSQRSLEYLFRSGAGWMLRFLQMLHWFVPQWRIPPPDIGEQATSTSFIGANANIVHSWHGFPYLLTRECTAEKTSEVVRKNEHVGCSDQKVQKKLNAEDEKWGKTEWPCETWRLAEMRNEEKEWDTNAGTCAAVWGMVYIERH